MLQARWDMEGKDIERTLIDGSIVRSTERYHPHSFSGEKGLPSILIVDRVHALVGCEHRCRRRDLIGLDLRSHALEARSRRVRRLRDLLRRIRRGLLVLRWVGFLKRGVRLGGVEQLIRVMVLLLMLLVVVGGRRILLLVGCRILMLIASGRGVQVALVRRRVMIILGRGEERRVHGSRSSRSHDYSGTTRREIGHAEVSHGENMREDAASNRAGAHHAFNVPDRERQRSSPCRTEVLLTLSR